MHLTTSQGAVSAEADSSWQATPDEMSSSDVLKGKGDSISRSSTGLVLMTG